MPSAPVGQVTVYIRAPPLTEGYVEAYGSTRNMAGLGENEVADASVSSSSRIFVLEDTNVAHFMRAVPAVAQLRRQPVPNAGNISQ